MLGLVHLPCRRTIAEVKENVTIDDLARRDIRVASILECNVG